MAKRNRVIVSVEHAPSRVLPQWERQRLHRIVLERRVRSVRRSLFAGGVIGTVAFSALAGYETKLAASSNADAESSVATATTTRTAMTTDSCMTTATGASIPSCRPPRVSRWEAWSRWASLAGWSPAPKRWGS